MDRDLRKQIEWHFSNHKANELLYGTQEREIIESGLTVDYGRSSGDSGISNPTEMKGILLCELGNQSLWYKVIENTIIAFAPEIQGEIINDKFVNKMKYRQLVEKHGNGHESVYDYRYKKILDLAEWWAVKYKLIKAKPLNYRW